MARSLGMAGCQVTLVVVTSSSRKAGRYKFRPVDCFSKYAHRTLFCRSASQDALVELLLNECTCPGEKVVLVPLGDAEAAAIDRHQDLLAPHFLFPHIRHEQGAVAAWMDKSRQKQLAAECGLAVAPGCTVPVRDGRFDLPDDVPYPAFVKPLATLSGSKNGMRRCDNPAELLEAIGRLAVKHPDTEVMVEAFRTIQTEYAVVGFSDGEHVVIPGVIEIMSMAHGGHFGVARQGRVLPLAGFEDTIEKFRTFVKRIGFAGLFDIDFYLSDNTLYFGEMNLRFGGSGYAFTACGINLPAMMVRTFAGQPLDMAVPGIERPAVFCNERMCLDDWCSGYIGRREMYAMILRSDIRFIFDLRDMRPQRLLMLVTLFRWLKRQSRKLRGRLMTNSIVMALPSWALDIVID